MKTLEEFIESRQTEGIYAFSREEAQVALHAKPKALISAIGRLKRKRKLLRLRRGFYIIIRPEDRNLGAPHPDRWIDPLMRYLRVDYRVSLLRAAAYHGSSHQAAMIYQVLAPKQLRSIRAGRQHVQFIFQESSVFSQTNRHPWLTSLKTDAGIAKLAGLEGGACLAR